MLIFLKNAITSLTNDSSSLLSLMIVLFQELMFSSVIGIVTDNGAWSDVRCQSGWIKWLSNSVELHQRNIRLMTEFESLPLLEYLVGTWLIGYNRFKLKESAIIMRSSLIEEWWGKDRSHKLSQMLKSPVITRRLWMFTSVSLRYFKTEWEESEYTFTNQKMLPLLKNEAKRSP